MPARLSSEIHRLLHPSERLLSRLTYPRKFVLIGLVLAVPSVWVSFSYIGVQNTNTSFANKEQVGLTYLTPTSQLLASIVGARTAAVDLAAHKGGASELQAARAAVSRSVAAVDAQSAAAAELALSSEWASLKQQITSADDAPVTTPAGAFTLYSDVSTGIQKLIANDGDNSNMILDPKNDAYYLMDAVLNRIPSLIDQAGQAADLQTMFAATGGASFDRRLQLEDLRAAIISTQGADLEPDYDTAFQNTHDTALAPSLRGPLSGFDRSISASVAQLAAAVHGSPASAAAAGAAVSARNRGMVLSSTTVPGIAHLLSGRIGGFNDASLRTILIALLGLLIAIYLFAGFYLSVRRSLLTIRGGLWELQENCMKPLTEALDAMADGDLTRTLSVTTAPVEEHTRDELNSIVKGCNTIRESIITAADRFSATNAKLRDLLGDVSTSARKVGSASSEMSTVSQEAGRATGEIAHAVGDVAKGAERQVMMLGDARNAADEVGTAVEESSRTARLTAQAAETARRAVGDGADAATEASEAMRSVRDSSAAVTAAIEGLEAKSQQIGTFVETISNIAEQTNLLALNAAIEAARAGDQGRGFAVVADEVRTLAEESQSAAGEIAAVINSIQDETRKTVEVVADGASRTEHGATVVERTREAFEQIGGSVDDVSGRVDEIAAVAERIARSVVRMQETIDSIAAVAQQSSAATEEVSASTEETSASAEEIATSAQELAGTAIDLEELVGQFRLND